MSSCKEDDEGDGEASDSVEGSTNIVVVRKRREGLFYSHAYV